MSVSLVTHKEIAYTGHWGFHYSCHLGALLFTYAGSICSNTFEKNLYFNLAYKLVMLHKIPKPFSAPHCCLIFLYHTCPDAPFHCISYLGGHFSLALLLAGVSIVYPFIVFRNWVDILVWFLLSAGISIIYFGHSIVATTGIFLIVGVHSCNCSTCEAEAGGLNICPKPELYRKTLSQKLVYK